MQLGPDKPGHIEPLCKSGKYEGAEKTEGRRGEPDMFSPPAVLQGDSDGTKIWWIMSYFCLNTL